MLKSAPFVALLICLTAQPSLAQVSGPRASGGCIDVSATDAEVSVQGRLTRQIFPGPPNYESIAAGDAEERIFIVELPGEVCVDDGGDFADPSERFITVHVSSSDQVLMDVLGAAVGRRVTVVGNGFASHTGHHHAPLVVLASQVTVR